MKFRLIVLLMISIFPNKLKIQVYRIFFNAKIGAKVKIGIGTIILANNIVIGNGTKLGSFNRIIVESIILGDYVVINNFNSIIVNKFELRSRTIISSKVSIKGDKNCQESIFRMDMNSWLFDECIVNVTRSVIIGKNVGIGGRSFIFTHGYWLSVLDGFPITNSSVQIGDNVWIPWNCFINPGVKIGNNVVLGARALVNKDIPSNSLAVGIPAKVIKESFIEVSSTDKMNLIKNIIIDFLKISNVKYDIIDKSNEVEIKLDEDNNSFVLLKEINFENDKYNPNNFYIVDAIVNNDIFLKNRFYSLTDYKCSSYDSFPKLVKSFFEFSRSQGLRFYPYNEK